MKNRFDAYFQRGNCYRQIKNYDLSIKDLQAVIYLNEINK